MTNNGIISDELEIMWEKRYNLRYPGIYVEWLRKITKLIQDSPTSESML
jgi:hypothetical protein